MLLTRYRLHITLSSGRPFYKTTAESNQLFQIFLGYLLSDTIGSVWHNRAWPGWQANLIHHATAGGIFLLFLVAELGHSLGIAAILLEITTPFVNTRWFLDKCGLKSSTLYMANGLAMTLLWLIVRVLGGAGIGVMLAFQWHEVPNSLEPNRFAFDAICTRDESMSVPRRADFADLSRQAGGLRRRLRAGLRSPALLVLEDRQGGT